MPHPRGYIALRKISVYSPKIRITAEIKCIQNAYSIDLDEFFIDQKSRRFLVFYNLKDCIEHYNGVKSIIFIEVYVNHFKKDFLFQKTHVINISKMLSRDYYICNKIPDIIKSSLADTSEENCDDNNSSNS